MFFTARKFKRHNKYPKPVNYKKYFKIGGSIFIVCILLAGILFLAGAANSYLASKDKKIIISPNTGAPLASDYEKKLQEYRITYTSVKIASNEANVIVSIPENIKAYFSPTKDISWQVSSLQQILNQLTIENKKPVYIDMRYEKPVVKF